MELQSVSLLSWPWLSTGHCRVAGDVARLGADDWVAGRDPRGAGCCDGPGCDCSLNCSGLTDETLLGTHIASKSCDGSRVERWDLAIGGVVGVVCILSLSHWLSGGG